MTVATADIYREYYELNDAEMCWLLHGYGPRSLKYLDAVRVSIGLVKTSFVMDPSVAAYKLPADAKPFVLLADGDAIVGEVNGLWLAEVTRGVDMDGSALHQYYFSRRPKTSDILTAMDIDKAENELSIGGEDCRCVYCGSPVHWLDAKAFGLSNKLKCLKDRACTCGQC